MWISTEWWSPYWIFIEHPSVFFSICFCCWWFLHFKETLQETVFILHIVALTSFISPCFVTISSICVPHGPMAMTTPSWLVPCQDIVFCLVFGVYITLHSVRVPFCSSWLQVWVLESTGCAKQLSGRFGSWLPASYPHQSYFTYLHINHTLLFWLVRLDGQFLPQACCWILLAVIISDLIQSHHPSPSIPSGRQTWRRLENRPQKLVIFLARNLHS